MFKNLCGGISDLIKKRRKIRLEYVLPWLMVATVILVMMWVLPAPTALAAKLIYLMFVFVLLIVSWWAVTHAKIWKNVRVLSINQLDECCPLKGDAKQMWKTYGNYGETHQRFFRTIGYVLVYFFFASILFALLGAPSSPCRGNYACGVAGATLGFGVLFMLIVLFLVFDSARLCICWVDSMRREDFDWSKTKLHNLVKALKLPIRHAKAWMVVYLIGERTATVTRLIYYPVIIILLLLLARSTYFDNWDFPQALAIVIAVNFSIALSGIMRLNYMARSVRNDILRGLQEEVFAHDESQIVGYDKSQTVEYEADPAKTEELIKQLEGLRIGAYLRVWDQPPVRATLMLLGGAALTYAEYLSVFIN